MHLSPGSKAEDVDNGPQRPEFFLIPASNQYNVLLLGHQRDQGPSLVAISNRRTVVLGLR